VAMMKGQRIAEACGIKFYKNLHKKFTPYDSDFSECNLPEHWFIEYSNIDGHNRLFAPSSNGRINYITTLGDTEKAIKLVKLFLDMDAAKCYSSDTHTFEVLSGSMGDFAFASAGQPKFVTSGFYKIQATIDHSSMANPCYDTFWQFDRAKYRDEQKFGIVKYNDRAYVPFVGVDSIVLMKAKKLLEVFEYNGEVVLVDEPGFHAVKSLDNFGKYH